MKRTYQILPLFLFLLICLSTSCSKVDEIAGCQFPTSMDSYQMVWNDEFDGPEIDLSKWSYDLGDGCDRSDDGSLCGWGNNELEYYTDRPDNSYIEDGKLVIKAQREVPFFEGKEYTSARMVTKNKGDWKYGRIDVRAKMPIGPRRLHT